MAETVVLDRRFLDLVYRLYDPRMLFVMAKNMSVISLSTLTLKSLN